MDQFKNSFFFAVGLLALAVASARHRLQGYKQPTDFSSGDWPRSIAHVRDIVEDWRGSLARHGGRTASFQDLRVLELGPGATLGTGVLLAGLGARSYHAIDAFPLAAATPTEFYRALAASDLPSEYDRDRMNSAIDELTDAGSRKLVEYIIDPDFDIARSVKAGCFDIIVSNAAFEHFNDIQGIIEQISTVAAPGALFVAMVDFQTHSRWVRQADPANIYRFGDGLYGLLAFPGQPNRQRPDDYLRYLARSGWCNAEVHAVDVAGAGYVASVDPWLNRQFRGPARRIDILTGVVIAQRPGPPEDIAEGGHDSRPVPST